MNASPNEEPAKPAETDAATESSSPSAEPAKQRSTAEKIIVRVLIVVLVLFAAVEARARFGYEQTLKAVQEEFEGEDNEKITKLSDLESEFLFFPSRTKTTKNGASVVELSWFSFVYKNKYIIDLTVSKDEDDPDVLSFMTPDAVLPEQKADPNAPGDDGGGGEGGEGGEGGGGPDGAGPAAKGPRPGGTANASGAGRRKLDPQAFAERLMRNDKNEDGKIALDEMPERMRGLFQTIDENKDKFITKDEIIKAAPKLRGRKRGNKRKRKTERPTAEGEGKKSAESGDKKKPETAAKPKEGDTKKSPEAKPEKKD